MYAGGLSYFSSGSVRDGLRVGSSPAPEAVASPNSKSKQIKKRVLNTIKHLKLKKGDRISEHTHGVHQIFSTQNRPRDGDGSDLHFTHLSISLPSLSLRALRRSLSLVRPI